MSLDLNVQGGTGLEPGFAAQRTSGGLSISAGALADQSSLFGITNDEDGVRVQVRQMRRRRPLGITTFCWKDSCYGPMLSRQCAGFVKVERDDGEGYETVIDRHACTWYFYVFGDTSPGLNFWWSKDWFGYLKAGQYRFTFGALGEYWGPDDPLNSFNIQEVFEYELVYPSTSLIPKLTGVDTTRALASTAVTGHEPWRAFDGSTATDWRSESETATLYYGVESQGDPKTPYINAAWLTLRAASDGQGAPRAFTLSGRSSAYSLGDHWDTQPGDVIETWTDETDWATGQSRRYQILTGYPTYLYNQFKLDITAANDSLGYVALAEMDFDPGRDIFIPTPWKWHLNQTADEWDSTGWPWGQDYD